MADTIKITTLAQLKVALQAARWSGYPGRQE